MAGSLGTLTLDLIAKIGGFTGPMDQAERRARKNAKGIKDAANEASLAWTALGGIAAGAFAGLSVGGLLSTFIAETKAAEQEQAQLGAVLASTGSAAGISRDRLNEMADALERTSTFSAGEITGAQTALLAFTGIVDNEFNRAMQSAIDMATRTGTTVQQAAETIGRALDVPSRGLSALSKQGFRFTKEQKELAEQLEATGRTAEAQGMILNELEKTYGGAAVAARDTFGGAMLALGNTFSGLMTGGDGSISGMTAAINAFNDALASPATKVALDTLGDAVVVLSALIATRLVVAAGASAVSFALAQKEVIRYQLALAGMAGISTRAAIGLTAVGVAARGASIAIGLLGGPVGAIIVAASALTYFVTRASDADKASAELDSRISKLGGSFQGMHADQAAAAIQDYTVKLGQSDMAAKAVAARVFTLNDNIKRFPGSPKLDEWKTQLVTAKGELVTAGQEVDGLKEKIEELNKIANKSNLAPAIESVSAAYKKLADDLDEQLLLIDKKTNAEKLEARIGAGLIEGLKAGEGDLLVAKQKRVDAAVAAGEAEKKREEEAKKSAKAAQAASEAVAKKAAEEARAIRESVAAIQLQAKQLGWTSSAIKLYELQTDGATQAQLKLAEAALLEVEAFEKQKKLKEDYKALVSDLSTEEEALSEKLRERMKILDAMPDLTDSERRSTASRIVSEGFEKPPEFSGIDASVGGIGGEIDKINDAEKKLEQWYQTQMDMLERYRSERADKTEEWDAEEEKIKQAHEDRLAGIEKARQRATLDVASEIFGNLTVLTQSKNKELVAIGKAAAVAQATISGFTAIQNALAVQPYPLGMALAVTAGVATAANIAGILGVGFKTGGYTGSGNPNEVAGQVHKGEFVFDAAATARLGVGQLEAIRSGKIDQAVSSVQASSMPGLSRSSARAGSSITQNINVSGLPDNRTANQIAAASSRKQRQASRLK